MSIDSQDVANLAAEARHEIGKCEEPGWCEICEWCEICARGEREGGDEPTAIYL